jgi:hypothetical protein
MKQLNSVKEEASPVKKREIATHLPSEQQNKAIEIKRNLYRQTPQRHH